MQMKPDKLKFFLLFTIFSIEKLNKSFKKKVDVYYTDFLIIIKVYITISKLLLFGKENRACNKKELFL